MPRRWFGHLADGWALGSTHGVVRVVRTDSNDKGQEIIIGKQKKQAFLAVPPHLADRLGRLIN